MSRVFTSCRGRWARGLTASILLVAAAVVLGACGDSSGGNGNASGGSAASTVAQTGGRDQALYDLLPERIKQTKTISVGALWETPPIISVDPKNTSKPVGITPDLAAAVGKILGVKVVWKNMQWPAQLPGLQSGNVDVLWGQVSDGKVRERIVDLVGFSKSPEALLVAGGNPHHIKSLADACGLKIGVPTGSGQELVVKGNSKALCTTQGKPAIKPVGYPGAQGAIVGLKAGTVDGWMDSNASISEIAKKSSGTYDSVVLPDDQIDPYMERVTGIAVAKSQPGLTKALAGAMKKLAESGEYQKIMKKWNSGDSALGVNEIKINGYTGIPAGAK